VRVDFAKAFDAGAEAIAWPNFSTAGNRMPGNAGLCPYNNCPWEIATQRKIFGADYWSINSAGRLHNFLSRQHRFWIKWWQDPAAMMISASLNHDGPVLLLMGEQQADGVNTLGFLRKGSVIDVLQWAVFNGIKFQFIRRLLHWTLHSANLAKTPIAEGSLADRKRWGD